MKRKRAESPEQAARRIEGKRTAAMNQARAEASARGYRVESVTWSDDLGAPVVQVWAAVQSVSREDPS